MSQGDSLFTDRRHLTTAAYPDSANLAARANIYRHQQPPLDLIGWALDQVRWDGTERVLDVGCGPGRYLRRLAKRPGLRLIGVDLSQGMLRDLESGWDTALPRPLLAVADAQALPLPDASCDVALAMHMLYHVPDIEQAARELRRVLRLGGILLAVTNGAGHTRELNKLYNAAVACVSGRRPTSERWSSRFGLENGAALLRSAFAQVDRHDVESTLEIPEPAPALAYLNSTRQTREPDLPGGVTWDAVAAEVEQMLEETIAREGVLRVRTHAGIFVCR